MKITTEKIILENGVEINSAELHEFLFSANEENYLITLVLYNGNKYVVKLNEEKIDEITQKLLEVLRYNESGD